MARNMGTTVEPLVNANEGIILSDGIFTSSTQTRKVKFSPGLCIEPIPLVSSKAKHSDPSGYQQLEVEAPIVEIEEVECKMYSAKSAGVDPFGHHVWFRQHICSCQFSGMARQIQTDMSFEFVMVLILHVSEDEGEQ